MVQKARDYEAAMKNVVDAMQSAKSAADSGNLTTASSHLGTASSAINRANSLLSELEAFANRVKVSSRTPDINERNAFSREMGTLPSTWVDQKRNEQASIARTRFRGKANESFANVIARNTQRPAEMLQEKLTTSETALAESRGETKAARAARTASEAAKTTALTAAKDSKDEAEKNRLYAGALEGELTVVKDENVALKTQLAACEKERDDTLELLDASKKYIKFSTEKYQTALTAIDDELTNRILTGGDLSGPAIDTFLKSVINPLKAESLL
jgi:hypothetical protein